MKKFRKLIPAFCMLLIAAMLLGTSTFAWFSMNTVVSAHNMEVKAVVDQGILINEVETASDANWDSSANTAAATSILLHATSTANTATWYVAYSKVADDAAAATSSGLSPNLTSDGYKVLGGTGSSAIATATQSTAATAGSVAAQAITYVDTGSSGYTNGEGYYVKYTYYLKSSADAITLTTTGAGQSLNIKSVTAEPQASGSADLDKALRVAVVIGGKAYIFAPVSGASLATYYVNATTATTPLDATVSQPTALTSLPAATSNGAEVNIYLYFEGEDTNLKTTNAQGHTLDDILVTVEFELVTNSGAVTDGGVSIS